MGQKVAARDLRPGERIWAGSDGQQIVDVSVKGDRAFLTIAGVHFWGKVTTSVPADALIELARRRE